MYPRRARFVGLKLEDFVKIDAKNILTPSSLLSVCLMVSPEVAG